MILSLSEITVRIQRIKALVNSCLLDLDEAVIQIARLERIAIRIEAI